MDARAIAKAHPEGDSDGIALASNSPLMVSPCDGGLMAIGDQSEAQGEGSVEPERAPSPGLLRAMGLHMADYL